MLLIVAATDIEMQPVRHLLADRAGLDFLVTGLGPVEAALSLTKYCAGAGHVDLILNFGVGGAFLDSGPRPGDICLAVGEYLGELGVCLADGIDNLANPDLPVKKHFSMAESYLGQAQAVLRSAGLCFHTGNFVTVAGVSGTAARGNLLRDKYKAICENMEGAAIARVAQDYGLACLEVRGISNMVTDRAAAQWCIPAAVQKCAGVVARLVTHLSVE